MFKRANKITSLLVAAASVMALVPAYAADVKKVDSEDGTVYNAVAYKDGKFFVDGEINDDEEAYYVADGKFSKLEDVDSGDGDDAVLFGEKYLDVSDGDYTVDLDKGSVTDDDVKGDTADDAAENLRKEAKDDTDDRYDETFAKSIIDKNESDTEDLTKMNILPGAKYSEPWYYTTYKAAGKAVSDNVNGLKKISDEKNQVFNVYTDTKGNYIDADYNLGKIKVGTTKDSVNVENTNDSYDFGGVDDVLTASVAQTKVLTQDKDYIYRAAQVTLTIDAAAAEKAKKADLAITSINGVEINEKSPALKTDDAGKTVTFNVVQKISKAQNSDEVDGAKYAKSVSTYVISNDDGSDASDYGLFVGDTLKKTNFTVVNNKLVAYNTDVNDNKKVTARAYSLKTSGGFYYLDAEDESSEDCENKDGVAAVQTDVDGNIWRLDGGYIYKFDGTDDWDKVFKVDGSFDELSVYDKDNMVAWSEDDDVYSLIGGKSADDNNGGETTTPVTTAGWTQTSAGWTYTKADGTKATGWLQDGGAWYYLKADGTMATGWVQDGATWYYLNGSGAMQTGWLNDNGTFYYLNGSGAMLSNTTTPDGYYVGANGAWVK
ncbi:N-acetylmuramoyl-L-alanine amidase family protein [Clostridium beijerinckii]|uniref:N-acetylmuramoyl-L-alanine amidase family protein n=1 Tax=Clostridium beijerinckii TaxID=1520 RepID=UPI0003D30756|nr:N-acetylmuramoyl-L-alanine amidase family protein [Clostridium beijerinckii]ALB44129.1 N-acetylmuramoyl-L-alanine amidase family protein [Clostridium beijerinckii NRRL B-598]